MKIVLIIEPSFISHLKCLLFVLKFPDFISKSRRSNGKDVEYDRIFNISCEEQL